MCVCVRVCVSAVPKEIRKGYWIAWSWNYRPPHIGFWELIGSFAREVCSARPSLVPPSVTVLKIYFYCVCQYMHTHNMQVGALRGQRYEIPLELGLEVVLTLLAWVLGTKLCTLQEQCVPITELSLACVVAMEPHTILLVQVFSCLSLPNASIVTTPGFQYFILSDLSSVSSMTMDSEHV